MALPSSGSISLSQVNVELDLSPTATISFNDSAVRSLFGVSSGAISMSNGYSKSNTAYVNDVFSTYAYTGTGASNTIPVGVDISTKGGMIWIKNRATSVTNNMISDTVTGITNSLYTNTTAGQSTTNYITSTSTNSFTLGPGDNTTNTNGNSYISWTFCKSPKFLDIVSYAGSSSDVVLSHNLGITPGMVIIKQTNTASTVGWYVWHRSLSVGGLCLNKTTPDGVTFGPKLSNITANNITVLSGISDINLAGNTYVAYIYAHDPGPSGIIQCGSFTASNPVILGWEPQFLLVKNITTSTGNWILADNIRGLSSSNYTTLNANLNTAESGPTGNIKINSIGFTQTIGGTTDTYIYMAIRRPNKPPSIGAQVFSMATYSGTSNNQKITTGIPVDMILMKQRTIVGGNSTDIIDRVRGQIPLLWPSQTTTETNIFASTQMPRQDYNDGVMIQGLYFNSPGENRIFYGLARAPGFFDVVCYTGSGSATSYTHNLAAPPELAIIKCRNTASNWAVYSAPLGNTSYLSFNLSDVQTTDSTFWNNTTPTSSVFTVGTNAAVNTNASRYVAYLFATLPGISKIGTYVGNGSTQVINCGFITGARFILIKQVDATGDWYFWDSLRGITSSGNDPYLRINIQDVAETTTDDSVGYDINGFSVNQTSMTNINILGSSYLFMSIS